VLAIQPRTNTVVVGSAEQLAVDRVLASRPVWIAPPTSDGFRCSVQLRAHGLTSEAWVEVDANGVTAVLAEPQRGVAAGQALVMYDGDRVLGSATISSADRVGASSR
jgi:tRNA-specific 2-thiouridylase